MSTTVASFSAWEPPAGVLQPALDYDERIDRYCSLGWLTGDEVTVLRRLLTESSPNVVVQHGDPVPGNVLVQPSGLVDWEFAGLYLPGWDLALLHTLLARSPVGCVWIEDRVAQAHIGDTFLLNKALMVTRELRFLGELASCPERRRRLALVQAQWERTRTMLRERG